MISYFDTTLRDGTQGEGLSLSAEDKVRIAQRLDALGIHYIEGGWPGSNPKDMAFFERAKDLAFTRSRIVAFGSTARWGTHPDEDPNLQALIAAGTPAVSIFGKSWRLHVDRALGITADQNIELIRTSVAFLKRHGKEVIYDAEHFFDGYKDDPGYALTTLTAARDAGADWLVLCDTNGGTLPHEVSSIVGKVVPFVRHPLGIHAHNDSETAVANSIAAVLAGCTQVQGTVNGYGERCGNANLCSVIPNLQLKLGYEGIPTNAVAELTSVSHFVSEVGNLSPQANLPYVGRSAFAHKGGVHVSAVMRDPVTYEHVRPEQIGNSRRVLVSDLSGRSNIRYKAEQLNLDASHPERHIPEIVESLKRREHEGFSYEAAEASFELLVRDITGQGGRGFALKGFRLIIEKSEERPIRTEATIRLDVDGVVEHTAAEATGPVHALDLAMRKALIRFYPEIADMHLSDYKVRVLNEKDGTRASVRVLIDSTDGEQHWGTVGVSDNIIEASWQALMDSVSWYLIHTKPVETP